MAGRVSVGEFVGVEFWLPRLEEPLRARAVVRHQRQLRCGLEFQGLSAEQQALIRSWTQRRAAGLPLSAPVTVPAQIPAKRELPRARRQTKKYRKLRPVHVRSALFFVAVLAVVFWWRWQHGWKAIEAQLPAKPVVAQPEVMVPGAEMEQRITHKVDPVYPEAARQAHIHGVVLLHAIIGEDGSVVKLEAVRGPQELFRAAMDAARWWRYEPYLLNGKPVGVETTLEVPFADYRVSVGKQ